MHAEDFSQSAWSQGKPAHFPCFSRMIFAQMDARKKRKNPRIYLLSFSNRGESVFGLVRRHGASRTDRHSLDFKAHVWKRNPPRDIVSPPKQSTPTSLGCRAQARQRKSLASAAPANLLNAKPTRPRTMTPTMTNAMSKRSRPAMTKPPMPGPTARKYSAPTVANHE